MATHVFNPFSDFESQNRSLLQVCQLILDALGLNRGEGYGQSDFRFSDWSFSQFCRMAGVSKETINRLSHKTASKALQETMPHSEKPFQVLTAESEIRSIHGVAYTRLWNDELLNVVAEAAPGFVAPQQAMNGATGLYCGEQDMFAFLIDPTGWVDINGQAFAPGFFIWNSEVGRRTVGVQSFWFQKVCQNHIVWDAVEVCESSRRHTARVRDLSNWWQAEFHHEKTRNLAGCANHESHAPTKMLQLTNSLRGLNFARQGSRVIKYLMT